MNEQLIGGLGFIAVATSLIPFITGTLKMLLERLDIKVRSKVLVGVVCASMALTYASVTQYAPQDLLVAFTALANVTFITSQALYKAYENKDKGNTSVKKG